MTSSMSTQMMRRACFASVPAAPLCCSGVMNEAPQRWACAEASRSPACQDCGVSRRGSQNRMRPQVSQVKIWSSCSRLVRSFQRCGRTIIWQAEHLWSMASERPLPLRFCDAVVIRERSLRRSVSADFCVRLRWPRCRCGRGRLVAAARSALGVERGAGRVDGCGGGLFCGLERLGALERGEFFVLELADGGFAEVDLVLERADLRGAGGGVHLLAEARDLAAVRVGVELLAAAKFFFGARGPGELWRASARRTCTRLRRRRRGAELRPAPGGGAGARGPAPEGRRDVRGQRSCLVIVRWRAHCSDLRGASKD